jgi:predicted DNA-binding protein
LTLIVYRYTLSSMKENIGIRLEPEKIKELKALAESKGHTLSSFVRWLIEMALKGEN